MKTSSDRGLPIFSIKNMPESERPRERLARQGPEGLSNAELLAILRRLEKLRRLDLSYTQVTPNKLIYLKNLPFLHISLDNAMRDLEKEEQARDLCQAQFL